MLLGDDDELNKAEEGLSIAPLIDCVFLLLIWAWLKLWRSSTTSPPHRCVRLLFTIALMRA